MESGKLVSKNLFHGRNEDVDIKSGHVDSRGRKSGTNRERSINTYTIPCVKQLVRNCYIT